MKNLVIACCLIASSYFTTAQTKVTEGNLSPEIKMTSSGKFVFMSIKEYNHPDAKKQKPKKGEPTPYLHLPLSDKNVTLSENLFTSRLICFNLGSVKWDHELGKTTTSSPTAMVIDGSDNVYAGEKNADEKSVTINKYDRGGELIWTANVVELDAVHEIFVGGKTHLTAIVSKGKDFFVLKLDRNKGGLLSKTAFDLGTALVSEGYTIAPLQSHEAAYYYKGDDLIYVSTDNKKKEAVLKGETAGGRVLDVIGEEKSFILLYKSSGNYHIIMHDWNTGEKIEKREELSAIPSDAKIIGLQENEIQGITVIYEASNLFGMVKLNKNMVTILERNNVYKSTIFQEISDVSLDRAGAITIVGISQEKSVRSISILQKSREGR